MCDFFSCVSDGKGTVRHFSIGDVADIMAKGNPKEYDFNSHTSYLHFLGEKGQKEDQWNKWEYNPDTKVLQLDTLRAENDELDVRAYLEKFFTAHNAAYVKRLFSRNTGNVNTGDRNTGSGNTGNGNTGNGNTGDRNTGNVNTGNVNTGNGNTGDVNTGNMNATDYASGHFNTKATRTMFNAICTQEEIDAVDRLSLWSWHDLNVWVLSVEMTPSEKKQHPSHATTGGFIRQVTPKQAWKTCPAHVLAQIMALPHFNAEVFKDISGIDVHKNGAKR